MVSFNLHDMRFQKRNKRKVIVSKNKEKNQAKQAFTLKQQQQSNITYHL